MRFANLAGRASIISDDGAIDAEKASGGRFPDDPMAIYSRRTEFRDWSGEAAGGAVPFELEVLGAPSPRPPPRRSS